MVQVYQQKLQGIEFILSGIRLFNVRVELFRLLYIILDQLGYIYSYFS